jgi:hypothetical protein
MDTFLDGGWFTVSANTDRYETAVTRDFRSGRELAGETDGSGPSPDLT